ncbi:MAG: SMI1/KNR4 family protein [Planctomycetota bacterium]
MAEFDWKAVLEDFNSTLLADPEICQYAEPTAVSSRWFGFPPASDQQVAAAESRLEVSFPPSYRQFLMITNGWRMTGWQSIGVLPVLDVDWLRNRDPELIEIWCDVDVEEIEDDEYFVYGDAQDCLSMRREYLQDVLLISTPSWANQDYFFLNPKIVFEGEWEAWHFSTEFPGACRYRSFYDLMLAELHGVKNYRF